MIWAQQPYYADAGLYVGWYGMILAGTFILGGMAGQLSHRIDHWGSNRMALGAMAGVLVVCCTVLSLVTSIWMGVILFFSGTLVYAMAQPRINAGINTRVGPERRATILSTASLMVHLLFIPSSIIVGAMSESGGISSALLWMAGQLLVLSVIGLWLWDRNGRQAASSSITGT
jgi:predicted MFS family arabinose efflux permease